MSAPRDPEIGYDEYEEPTAEELAYDRMVEERERAHELGLDGTAWEDR